MNAFCRTEFNEILNSKIETINGVDKKILEKILKTASNEEDGFRNVTDVLKLAEVKDARNLRYVEVEKNTYELTKDGTGYSLLDQMIANDKLEANTIDDIISKCKNSLSNDEINSLQSMATDAEKCICETMVNDLFDIEKIIGENENFVFKQLSKRFQSLATTGEEDIPDFIEHTMKNFLEKKGNQELAMYLYENSDDILNVVGKDTMEIGDYIIKTGEGVTLNLQDEASISIAKTEIETAEEALENGYELVKNSSGKVFRISIGRIIKVLDITAKVVITYDLGKTLISAELDCLDGNYRDATEKIASTSTRWGYDILTNVLISNGMAFLIGAGVCNPVITTGLVIGAVVVTYIQDKFAKFLGDEVGEYICDFLGIENNKFKLASLIPGYRSDPLVIDFDGDGFETLSINDGVYFDEDATGLVEKTSWINADEALLTIDLNGNGIIDDGSELFGTSTKLSNGSLAQSGYEALRGLDTNEDNIIDSNDEQYNKILIWRDKNSNGISESEELYTLEELGISSISLESDEFDGYNESVIKYNDGHTIKMREMDFDAQYYNTKEKESIEISDEIESLPDVKAIGNVASLHTLMQLDESGKLKELVKSYTESNNLSERKEILTNILYNISGAEDIEANSRGSNFDAKKLTVIEKFMGKNFVGVEGTNPVNTAATILESIYNDIFRMYFCILETDDLLDVYNKFIIVSDDDGIQTINTDLFDAVLKVQSQYGEDVSELIGKMGLYIETLNINNPDNFRSYISKYFKDEQYLNAIIKYCYDNKINGTDEDEKICVTTTNTVVYAGVGDDTINGSTENDFLYGESGNDNLYGGDGDDILVGGDGDDYMSGDVGADTYIHERGDGNDTINNWDTTSSRVSDKLILKGIKESEVEVSRSGYNLVIKDTVSNETVTVQSAFCYSDGSYYLENVEFDDGSWGKEELAEKALVIKGSDAGETIKGYGATYNYSANETIYAGSGNDMVYGYNGTDTLYGESGNDNLYGGDGDDILVGGAGDDYMSGDVGADTYIHERGDGNDTINNYDTTASRVSDKLILKGIKESEVEVSRSGYNLVIKDTVSNETVTIQSAYCYSDGSYYLENVEFDDGNLYNVDYNNIVMNLVESSIKEEDIDSMVSAATDILDSNSDALTIDSSISLDNATETSIDTMTNLVVQDISENSTENVTDITNNSTSDNSGNYAQLWTAN